MKLQFLNSFLSFVNRYKLIIAGVLLTISWIAGVILFINYSEYKQTPNSAILTLKPMRDSLLILQKYLKQTHFEVTPDGVAIYVFEK